MKNRFEEKVITLWRIIKFFYGRYPKETLLRDLIFIIVIVAEMFTISVAGKFLDSTIYFIKNTEVFNFEEYVSTDSFYYLSLGLFLWCIVNIGNKVRYALYENINDKMWADTQLDMLRKISDSNLQDVEHPYLQQLLDFVPVHSIDKLMLSYSAFSDILSQIVRLVTAFSIMYSTLGWSVAILFVCAIPEVILAHFNRKRIQLYNDNQMYNLKYVSYVNNIAQDIRNFPELRVDGTYGYLRNSMKKHRNEYMEGLFERRKHYWIDKVFGSVVDNLFKYGYIVYILSYSIRNKLSIGSFSALFNYADTVYNASYSVMDTIALLDNYLGYTSKYFDFVHFQGFGDQEHGTIKLPKGTPSLEFLSLDFAYPDDPETKILENINLKIEPGEKVVFFGGDGSGKSSMIKLLTGLYEVIAGDYSIGGYSIRELDRGELKKKISVTFQNFVNYNFSIRENITIASNRKNVDRDLYDKVLRITGIKEIMKKERIKDTVVLGKYLDGKELSPGYWQRLAIARMLYRNKQIFIMDEPFTFIDGPSREKLLRDIIKFVGPNRTLIHITRNTDDLDLFDRIYYFEKGHIVEAGDWKELMKKKGKLYKEAKYNR